MLDHDCCSLHRLAVNYPLPAPQPPSTCSRHSCCCSAHSFAACCLFLDLVLLLCQISSSYTETQAAKIGEAGHITHSAIMPHLIRCEPKGLKGALLLLLYAFAQHALKRRSLKEVTLCPDTCGTQ